MRLLTSLFVFALLLLSTCSADTDTSSESTTKDTTETVIYFSRHAEKAGGENPGLLPEGKERADRLAARLRGENIAAVYATGFRRTQETAAPTVTAAGVALKKYGFSANPERTTKRWAKKHRGETILVVGHSNTVPGLVNALVPGAGLTDISENDYDNLYKVTIPVNGEPRMERLSSAE